VITAEILVCPDLNTPFEPGGNVNKSPGLSKIKRTAGTIRSALVIVIPRTREIAQYTATKMSALTSTSSTDVFMSVNTPGLRT